MKLEIDGLGVVKSYLCHLTGGVRVQEYIFEILVVTSFLAKLFKAKVISHSLTFRAFHNFHVKDKIDYFGNSVK